MEAHVAEVGLYESRLEVGDAYSRVSHVDAQTVRNRLYGCLCGAIHIAASISSIASYATHIDDVSLIALHHSRNDEAGHGEESLYVGVDHRVPVLQVALIFLVQSKRQTSIIDEHVNLLPFSRNRIDSLLCSFSVANVKDKREHLRAFCLQLRLYSSQLVRTAGCKNKTVTSLCKTSCTGFSDATCSTRDQCYFHNQCLS